MKKEVQSRREFFKMTAKKVLPIIGGALLVGSSSLFTSCEDCDGCGISCSAECSSGCSSTCKSTCSSSSVGHNVF